MAVSKLWPVTVRLATVLDYASNPEKTSKAKSKYSNADYQALRDVVNYVKNGEKTEQEFFCEGINCTPAIAREQFVTVKEQFDKTDGIQAYHGYLSFKETDITPELAQHIGMEFANSVWGKKYQVLVTTHLNTEHLHCHFVINSVSFVDGKRCRDTSWFKFYKEADRICEKYGISTIKEPERYPDAKYLTQKDKAGMPTRYNLARSALDEAIAMSHNLRQLEYHLSEMGYNLSSNPKRMKEFLDDLTTRDQRMMFAVLTMVHTADTKEQLDNDTEALLTTARKHLCQFGVLKFQQLDGLNTAMPFGVRKIESFRTLTTESLAVFIPFRVQDICHSNGVYYGQNVISKNMIIADRRQLLNGNEFILGVSGGGKSFTAKGEIINQVLAGDADIIIIDPEREYSPLVRALGGEIINISATSPTHINAMDMNREYGDGANPVILKSEFIMSLCEQLIGGNNLGAVQKSIIDRCTASVYRTYQQNNYTGEVPTLQDFRAELLKQSEPEAQEIALAIELFTNGSLNTFAKKTNVDTDNRLICYDILDLGKQLMPIGMLVVLDSILNRITQNRAKGKNTFIFIDEIYLLFQHEYSANFLFTLWKRVRKYGAYATGITQNVDDLLQSHTARTMLANSEFIVMLNQASTDRLELAKLLNISDTQLSYITNVDAGHGLIKVGSSLVPFANKFPKNTKLYKLMTTKPGEGA